LAAPYQTQSRRVAVAYFAKAVFQENKKILFLLMAGIKDFFSSVKH